MQNYFGQLWNHTWSLAVEEHFYLLLTFFFVLALRYNFLKYRNIIRASIMVVMLGCLILRIYLVMTGPISLERNYFPTHLRADSLFFGVLLADFYHYDRKNLNKFYQRNKLMLIFTAIMFILPLFFLDRKTNFMASIGLSLLSFAFGIVLIIFLCKPLLSKIGQPLLRWPIRLISKIGFYSYSIYLWHMFVASFVMSFISNTMIKQQTSDSMIFCLYLVISIVTGIVFAKIIEIPALKLREKLFPSII